MAQENKNMNNNIKNVKQEKKEEKKAEVKEVVKPAQAPANVPAQTPAPIAIAVDSKKEEKKDDKKDDKKAKIERPKKEEAIAKGTNLSASKKHCMYICSFIKNKSVDQAIKELNEVIILKRVIPMKGEIPHRSAPGIMSGRYPINASKQFIYLLKALKGNIIANGLDLDKARISFASATWASRPSRRGGTRFKRAFVLLKAKEFDNQKTKEKKK